MEEAKLELVTHSQTQQKRLADLKQLVSRSEQETAASSSLEEHLDSIISRSLPKLEGLLRTEVSCMTEQNRYLTELIEEAGDALAVEIDREREQCKLMMQRHYDRLEHCVEFLLERS